MYYFIFCVLFFFVKSEKHYGVKHLHRNGRINKKIEEHTDKFMLEHYSLNKKIDDYEDVEIPIIFHVIYNKENEIYEEDTLQKYVVDVLNEDFNMKNEDIIKTPDIWKSRVGNFKIKFTIKDIKYVETEKEYWDLDTEWDYMKYKSYGGSDVIDPELNLNIWVVDILPDKDGMVTMGYAQFASEFNSYRKTDGFVLNTYSIVRSEIGLRDRTSTHEIGHWLNLRHIWGDGGCDVDDGVEDTPLSDSNHIMCDEDSCKYPKVKSCGSADMFMNYMSYGDITYMFTKGQALRSRALFEKGGIRYSIVTQKKEDAPEEDSSIGFVIVIFLVGIISLLLFISLLVNVVRFIKKMYGNFESRNVELASGLVAEVIEKGEDNEEVINVDITEIENNNVDIVIR